MEFVPGQEGMVPYSTRLIMPFFLSAVITEPAGSNLGAPFTSCLPPELQVLKDEQAHRLAPKGNQSRILRHACKRMAEEAKQKVCGSEENTYCQQADDLGGWRKR